MACSFAPPIPSFTYHSSPFFYMDNQQSCRVANAPRHTTTTRPQPTPLTCDNYVFPRRDYSPGSPLLAHSPHSFSLSQRNQHDGSAWTSQPPYPVASSHTHSFTIYPTTAPRASSNAQRPPHTKSHSRSYSGESQHHYRRSSQSSQGYYPLIQPQSSKLNRRTPSPPAQGHYSGGSNSSSSPILSPLAFSDALAPVHPLYHGLPRTESGLIPIPSSHRFNRGEIVMTRTTRRLMKTSSTGRLTARHPCLILESTSTHVRVLQMTSHVGLTLDQVRAVGAELQHWLARDDADHRDQFGRRGLETSPPSSRAGYIWVGDGGEWVPIEHVKYLTGTRVEESEIRRLESLAEYHVVNLPFRAYNESSP